ncbi:MAG TPA: tannase/feruloyl esterase family alpha/beta hydrolase [Amycolatopsis sp.]|nr:tannase/feruloyl esterase family alpha/beta hydrolase [Amycolatopsis sp.]
MAVTLAVTLAVALVVPAAAAATGSGCGARAVTVPGAAYQESACLADLTTTGTLATGHTVAADWAGLTSAGLPVPGPVPGLQIDGYFPDDSTTNTNHGWNHDAQFVLRLPRNWNGGLVVTGSPGNRRQYANDRAIADQVLAEGYAFAATDKGNTGSDFFTDGKQPGDAMAEWNFRVTQLTIAAKATLTRYYGRPPVRTLAAGLSNGGYLVRWQLENRPELYDGGVDWEGTLWTQQDNPLTFLPPALRGYPDDPQSIVDAGFAPGSEFLWAYHYQVYWDLTQRIYRAEFDPGYDGDLAAGIPFCTSGTPYCDADYDYAARPPAVHRAVEKIALTGRIGKPLITLQGTLDSLLPISRDSDIYDRMIQAAGRGSLHRYYRIEDGNHVDGLVDTYPDLLRPLAPCFRSAFAALEGWLNGRQPPRSATIARPAGASPAELAASCTLS